MSRDRKFKAWDKESKRWLDISHLLLDSDGKVIGYTVGNDTWTIDKVELVEWIGFHDKKHVPIFEGDRLGGICEGCIIVWIPEEARFGIDVLGETDEIHLVELSQEEREVIGNKWET